MLSSSVLACLGALNWALAWQSSAKSWRRSRRWTAVWEPTRLSCRPSWQRRSAKAKRTVKNKLFPQISRTCLSIHTQPQNSCSANVNHNTATWWKQITYLHHQPPEPEGISCSEQSPLCAQHSDCSAKESWRAGWTGLKNWEEYSTASYAEYSRDHAWWGFATQNAAFYLWHGSGSACLVIGLPAAETGLDQQRSHRSGAEFVLQSSLPARRQTSRLTVPVWLMAFCVCFSRQLRGRGWPKQTPFVPPVFTQWLSFVERLKRLILPSGGERAARTATSSLLRFSKANVRENHSGVFGPGRSINICWVLNRVWSQERSHPSCASHSFSHQHVGICPQFSWPCPPARLQRIWSLRCSHIRLFYCFLESCVLCPESSTTPTLRNAFIQCLISAGCSSLFQIQMFSVPTVVTASCLHSVAFNGRNGREISHSRVVQGRTQQLHQLQSLNLRLAALLPPRWAACGESNWEVAAATKSPPAQSTRVRLASCYSWRGDWDNRHEDGSWQDWWWLLATLNRPSVSCLCCRRPEGRGHRGAAAAAQGHDVPPGNAAADPTPAAGGPQRDPGGTDQHSRRPSREQRRGRAPCWPRPERPRQEEEVER